MNRRTGRDRAERAPGPLRRSLPLLLLSLLVVALSVPAGIAIAPALRGPGSTVDAAPPAPWQLAPSSLDPGHTGPGALSASPPLPDPAVLAARLNDTLKPDGAGTFSGVVQDAATGAVLFDRAGNEARVPASNMKLLTAAAALRILGPDRRFSTTVVAGSTAGTVVLTGGGDVLLGAGDSAPDAVLGHAGLATLAQATVRALQDGGATGTLTVQLDDSLFTGPSLDPDWSLADVAAGETAPLFPLALNSARLDPARTAGPRPADAAMDAAKAFSARLSDAAAAAGLKVAPGIERVTPPAGEAAGSARILAEVRSATVGRQVELLLQTSDNFLTEAMGRMAALASGRPGSNDGATGAVLEQLADLGISSGTLHLADVSGLALANRVSARQLAEVVRTITSGTDARLRAALAGFPVAGLTGTLADRYAEASTASGAGLVRAKTGTLNTVAALSGYVVDADGRLLVFSFLGNGLAPGAGNRAVLDRAASALAGCGCR